MSDSESKLDAERFLKFLIDAGESALKDDTRKYFSDADSEKDSFGRPIVRGGFYELNLGLEKVRPAYEQLCKFYVENQHARSEADVEHGYLLLCDLMAGAYLIGARATLSDSTFKKAVATLAKMGGSQKIEKEWHVDARRLAIEIRSRNPKASQAEIVLQIRTKIPLSVGDNRVKQWLADEEKNGTVPRSTRNPLSNKKVPPSAG